MPDERIIAKETEKKQKNDAAAAVLTMILSLAK